MAAVIPPSGSSSAHPFAGKTKPIVYFVGLTAALEGIGLVPEQIKTHEGHHTQHG